MITVRATTSLPIAADAAFALALKPATFAYVARGVMRVPALDDLPGGIFAAPGVEVSGRLWWLGVLPTWTHHMRVVEVGDAFVQTTERGGPVRTWNHRLAFRATSPTTCEYTDTIEIDAGPMTLPTALFARAFFALRQARWRQLARVLG